MDEKRSAVRWNISLPLRYTEAQAGVEEDSQTLDLTAKGAQFATRHNHRIGACLDMVLELEGQKGGPVCVEADVVWQSPASTPQQERNYLTGVAFRKIRECHKKSIFDCVYLKCRDQFRQNWWQGV